VAEEVLWVPRTLSPLLAWSLPLRGWPSSRGIWLRGHPKLRLCASSHADGTGFDFICGDEVYGGCTQLREFFEVRGQAYVLRVVATFMVTLAKLGLDQCQARLCTAIIRNIVLVMAAPARTPLALDRPVVRRFRPTT
jgi:hypothetical protein